MPGGVELVPKASLERADLLPRLYSVVLTGTPVLLSMIMSSLTIQGA